MSGPGGGRAGIRVTLLALLPASGIVPGLLAQTAVERPLTMDRAVEVALDGSAEALQSRLRVQAARAGARGAGAFLWPSLALEAGAVRSDDPVAVFGAKLRQGRFGQADLAVDPLNHPDPVTDWTGGVAVRWALLDPGRWASRDAARWEARAAELGDDRTREAVAYRTRILYLDAVGAQGRRSAALDAEAAARATADRVRRRRGQGLLTDADVFRADAEVEGARARMVAAEHEVATTRERLAVHLGWSAHLVPVPIDTVVSGEPRTASGSSGDLARRPDLRALEARTRSAAALEREAARSRLPALEAFGRLSTHAEGLAESREENWTAGIQLRWPLFAGFGISARGDEAEAARRTLESRLDQARREADAQRQEALRAVEATALAMEASRLAAEAAREGLRLVRRRFQEGMATTADLLQAQARAAELDAEAVDAGVRHRMARATLRFVMGEPEPDGGAAAGGRAPNLTRTEAGSAR